MKVTAQVIQHKGGDMTLKYAVKPKKKRKNKTSYGIDPTLIVYINVNIKDIVLEEEARP
ncbi:hypothetical protein YC2023_051959 [Brassica napus]